MNHKKTYKYYIIYETKGFKKSYIGWHATNNLDDGYLGSGKILKNVVKKQIKIKTPLSLI